MIPCFNIVRGFIPAFFKDRVKLELQIISQLRLTLLVESLLINFGEGDVKIVENGETTDRLLYGVINIFLLLRI